MGGSDRGDDYLTERNGVWHFIRRVPVEFSEFDKRNPIRLSTKIRVARDRKGIKARRVVDQMNIDVEAFWRGAAAGRGAEARQDYDQAVKIARRLGLEYLQPEEAAEKPLREMLQRIETAMQAQRGDDPVTTAAILGGVPKPAIMLSGVFDEFDAGTRAQRIGYSPNQLKKWQNAKRRAMEILVECIGDKDINELSRDDALKFRDMWQDRVIDEGIDIGTANKNITHISGMFNTLNELHRLRLDQVFAGTRLKRAKGSKQ